MKYQKIQWISLFTGLVFITCISTGSGQAVKDKTKKLVITRPVRPLPANQHAGQSEALAQKKLSKADSLHLIQLQAEKKKIILAKRLYKAQKYARSYLLLKRYARSEVFDAEAGLYLGMCYLKPLNSRLPDPEKAILYLKQATKSSKTRVASSVALGQLYMTGSKRLLPDINRAVIYLKQADAAHATQATYLLGQLMFYGTGGIVPDEPKGIQYLEKAANAGVTDAQWTLATIYTQGTPTFPRDLKQAKIWYQKVAKSRQKQSDINL